MANDSRDSEAQSGQLDGPGTIGTTANTSASRKSPGESRKSNIPPTVAPPPLQKQLSSTLVPTTNSGSAGASPKTSRNTSPVRKDSRQQPLSNPPSTQPSAAAIQRALSAANVPQLQAGGVSEAVSKLPKASKGTGTGDTTPRWPSSPRVTSPPPSGSNSRRGSNATQQKKPEIAATPTINVQSATPQTSSGSIKQGGDETTKVQQLQAPMKGLSRGPSGKSMLETVQENSADDVREPSAAAVKAAADLKPLTRLDEGSGKPKAEAANADNDQQHTHIESGSESAGAKVEKRKEPSSIAQRPKNYNSLSGAKTRQPEAKQNMTVETEVVQSIPQSAFNAGDRSGSARNDNSGSIRLKPSNETIRPKKERKKPTQKARSINQGTGALSLLRSPLLTRQASLTPDISTDDSGADSCSSSSTARGGVSASEPNSPQLPRRSASYAQQLRDALPFRDADNFFRTLSNRYLRKASSKADIFEARVANAVDEANSSDSEETFVYESNPPEPQRRARHHSRTPSVTSSHSLAEGQRSAGIRSFVDAMDDRRVAGKRSMKFSNNAYNDMDSPDGKDGSVRSHTPRHFGRFGRGGSQQSMFDPDSPFTQASKLRSQQLSARHSTPNSPRSPLTAQQQRTSGLFGKKSEPSYDFDAEGGDDERTPLIGTVRTPRNGRLPRRIHSHTNPIDEYYGVRRRGRLGRFGGCVLGFIVVAAAMLSAMAFLVMSNRPMYAVKIRRIQNVLASEQELMLDLLVGAVNPNALGISVKDMDVNIFAKSKHGSEEKYWRDRGSVVLTTSTSVTRRKRRRGSSTAQENAVDGRRPSVHIAGGVDEGTDPPDDDDLDSDPQTMLLGRITHFDQGLDFEGSPLKRHLHYSVGELRLDRPGNKTEPGGSERWKDVIQYPFELILKGVLKYQLPISSRVESAAVSASILVHPEDGVDEKGNMRVEPVDHSEDWQWVEWSGLEDDEETEVRERR